LYEIAFCLQEEFPKSAIVGDLEMITAEILKNAFVHGNQLNFEYPIYLHLRRLGDLSILEIFDVASTEKANDKEMTEADAADLWGAGAGERQWLLSAPYKRQAIKDESGSTIGTVASLVLNPRGWDNPLVNYPDILIFSPPIQGTQVKSTSDNVGSTPVKASGEATFAFGGIDFRTLPAVTQAISNLGLSDLPLARFRNMNLDIEQQEIERLVNAGIMPSSERVKEYAQASFSQGGKDIRKVASCIMDILRLEEERCCQTEPILKDILVVIESGKIG